MKDLPLDEQLWKSAISALLYIPPKVLLSYFVAYIVINKIIKDRSRLFFSIVEIIFAFAISILVYRLISDFIMNPFIYEGRFPRPYFWEPSRILISIMDLGFVTGLVTGIKLVRRQLNAKQREKDLVKEKLETELKFLRNQINPHFLFNTLNNIYALARKKADETPEVVMKLSKLLRFILYDTGKRQIPLSQEIKMLEDYIELEKLRYNTRLSVTFDKHIENGSGQIAPLLLLPFVENAFKHGISETRFNSHVAINIQVNHGNVFFSIENSKDSDLADGEIVGIGLGNVKRQLELMYGDYNLDIRNDPTTFKVELIVNLDSYAKI